MNTQANKTKPNKTANGVNKPVDPEASEANAPVAEKLKKSLHETVDALAEKAGDAEKTLRSGAANSSEVLNEKQQQIQQSWEASSVRKFAVENPVATAGMSFVAGALFGKFLSRN
ncbi:DUF883 domain-containing protein [Aliiglaciecola litoralis]|uniref:DUF883 domain-containing protein n=1 Tax=Aliiglaciecola litoralis TaxID=582857 RepID=A0ABN1LES6_9ALTE